MPLYDEDMINGERYVPLINATIVKMASYREKRWRMGYDLTGKDGKVVASDHATVWQEDVTFFKSEGYDVSWSDNEEGFTELKDPIWVFLTPDSKHNWRVKRTQRMKVC